MTQEKNPSDAVYQFSKSGAETLDIVRWRVQGIFLFLTSTYMTRLIYQID